MKPPTDRRAVLAAAGAAAIAMAAGSAAAQSADVRGAVTFAGGAVVPEGQLAVYLEDPAIQDKAGRRIAKTVVDSDGGSRTIDFSLSLPADATASPTLQIVARLERADGWLLARGSAPFKSGLPMAVTLNKAVYQTSGSVAEHCEKGMKVLVHGYIHHTKWTDATGTDRDDEIPF